MVEHTEGLFLCTPYDTVHPKGVIESEVRWVAAGTMKNQVVFQVTISVYAIIQVVVRFQSDFNMTLCMVLLRFHRIKRVRKKESK